MNKLKVILLTIVCSTLSIKGVCQNKKLKNTTVFNFGVQRSNTSSKFFWTLTNEEPIVPNSQKDATTFDVNIQHRIYLGNKGLGLITGIGENLKGYNEKGVEYGSSTGWYYYSYKYRRLYTYLSFGIIYKVKEAKNFFCLIGQSVVPEINFAQADFLHKKVAFSERTFIELNWKNKKNNSFTSSIYFQYALTKYNKLIAYNLGSNYRPYCFGLSVGYALNKYRS